MNQKEGKPVCDIHQWISREEYSPVRRCVNCLKANDFIKQELLNLIGKSDFTGEIS